jgi:hypothetical protein
MEYYLLLARRVDVRWALTKRSFLVNRTPMAWCACSGSTSAGDTETAGRGPVRPCFQAQQNR